MEHSVEAYLKRLSKAELEEILHSYKAGAQAAQYAHLLPLVQKILLMKQKE